MRELAVFQKKGGVPVTYLKSRYDTIRIDKRSQTVLDGVEDRRQEGQDSLEED